MARMASSAGSHLKGRDDILVKAQPLIEMVFRSLKRFSTTDAKDREIEI